MFATAILGYWNHRHYQLVLMAKNITLEQQQQELEKLAQEFQEVTDKMASESATEEQNKNAILEAQQARDKAVSDFAEVQKQLAAKDAELATCKNDLLAKEAAIQSLTAPQDSEASTPADSPFKASKKKIEKKQINQKSDKLVEKPIEAQPAGDKKNPSTGAMKGKVAAINPTWKFMIINLGENDGMVSGSELLIKRGSQVIGKVKITSVEPSTSVGNIVTKSVAQGVTIQVGDEIVSEEK